MTDLTGMTEDQLRLRLASLHREYLTIEEKRTTLLEEVMEVVDLLGGLDEAQEVLNAKA